MATIRFLSPNNPSLVLSQVPATFVDGVCDIDETDTDRLSRMAYAGPPYGVIRLDAPVADTPWPSEATIAADLTDVETPIGEAAAGAFESKIDRTGATDGYVPVLQSDGTFALAQPMSGTGAVDTVNGVSPDVNGNVALETSDVPGLSDALAAKPDATALNAVAFSGDYGDLTNKPVLTQVVVSDTQPAQPATGSLVWVKPAS